MSAARHEELQRIFTRAARLGPGDRTTFIEQACRDEPGLREEVLELLAADAEEDDALDPAGGAELLAGFLARSGELDERPARQPDRIGKYRVLRVIGQGGMGVVYEAEEEHPRRRVALKVVRPWLVTDELLQRFRHEARVLGHLQHPGIARIYEAGSADTEAGALPYFAMELVEGEPLDQYAKTQGLDVAGRLELIARLCDVLHYAHERGVIHRDIKPANVLVTSEPSATPSPHGPQTPSTLAGQPKILDFGIARATEADVRAITLQTSEGQLVGTIPYMSPEQASGDPAAIDVQSDVYAVGVLTYELLTGRLPYEVHGRPVHDAVRIIREQEPSSLGALDRALRGDVETIVAKALEKDKERRYRSAAELADDIRRHLLHQPIEARAASAIYQLRKFARRNRTLVGGVLATLVVAVTGAVVATGFALEATRRADELERASYLSGLAAASAALTQQDYATAASSLASLPLTHRGWEYDHLRARLVQHDARWAVPEHLVTAPVFDPEGRRVMALMIDGSIGTWDASDGGLIGRVAVEGISTVDEEATSPVAVHGPSLRFAARSADGGILVGSLETGEVARVDTGDGVEAARVQAWDAAGQRVLYQAGGTRIWDGERSLLLSDEEFSFGTFDHSGERVALAEQYQVALLDATTGELLHRCELDDTVRLLAFAPDDELLAVAGNYLNVYLLDGRTLDRLERMTGQRSRVDGMAWEPGGSRLATLSADGSLWLWDREQRGAPTIYSWGAREASKRSFVSGAPPASSVTFTPDGEHLLVAGAELQRFPLDESDVLRGHETFVYRVSFSPDGSLLSSAGFRSRDVLVWDAFQARVRWRLQGPTFSGAGGFGDALRVAFSEDGRRLVAGSAAGTTQWDTQAGTPLPATSANPHPVEQYFETLARRALEIGGTIAVSPNGERLATCPSGDRVLVFAVDVRSLPADWPTLEPGLFPAEVIGRYVQAEPIGSLAGHEGQVRCAAFSPDGARIATGGDDATIRIWNAESFEELLVLRGHEQYVMDLAFSPDGSMLASASGDTTVRLWDTRPLHERRAMSAAEAATGD